MKKFLITPLLFTILLLGGCQTVSKNSSSESETAASPTSVIDASSLFSDRDLSGSYDDSTAISIQLEDTSIICNSDSVSIDGTQITLLDEGTYIVSGTLSDGQIAVNADDTDKVQIVLSDADITSSSSAAIYSLNADKLFLTSAEGTDNTLTNSGSYASIDENNIDAVIFSKTDLTLNGSGNLTINAQAGHGVVSKDDLTITGGNYFVTASEHGIAGKDSLAISGGSFQITSGKDGLHAENTDDTAKGFLYIKDGTYVIHAQGDAISASKALQIDGGTFDLTAGEGSASVTMPAEDSFAPGGHGKQPAEPSQGKRWGEQPSHLSGAEQPSETVNSESETDSTENSISQKGIKSEGTLLINDCTFTVDSSDDCIHSSGALTVISGGFTISSGDDAIHADDAVSIENGTFSIPYCYEGIEGLSITIDGGSFHITSHDDGFNAAGGADSSGFGGRDEPFASSEDTFIVINGGEITVTSNGDCLDSNGNLSINGGTLDLSCNGNGNTALDCSGIYANTGGTVQTNDGSESNPGSMGGGKPADGQKQAHP